MKRNKFFMLLFGYTVKLLNGARLKSLKYYSEGESFWNIAPRETSFCKLMVQLSESSCDDCEQGDICGSELAGCLLFLKTYSLQKAPRELATLRVERINGQSDEMNSPQTEDAKWPV